MLDPDGKKTFTSLGVNTMLVTYLTRVPHVKKDPNQLKCRKYTSDELEMAMMLIHAGQTYAKVEELTGIRHSVIHSR